MKNEQKKINRFSALAELAVSDEELEKVSGGYTRPNIQDTDSPGTLTDPFPKCPICKRNLVNDVCPFCSIGMSCESMVSQ